MCGLFVPRGIELYSLQIASDQFTLGCHLSLEGCLLAVVMLKNGCCWSRCQHSAEEYLV